MIANWRKSSYTGGANDEHCVEVARLADGIGVRDSKNTGLGRLDLTGRQFAGLLAAAQDHDARAQS